MAARHHAGAQSMCGSLYSKREFGKVYPTVKYLSLLLGTGMFLHVVCHRWSSHVSSRVSVRLCLLHSECQRASRALGAARPSYLSAAISMWMLQVFGCGIFPHTGSYQSRLTGHCLYSMTERPGLEKKNTHKRQMSSLKPCSTLYPHSLPTRQKTPQFPLLPGMNKSVQLPCFTLETSSPIPSKSNIRLPEKRQVSTSLCQLLILPKLSFLQSI